MSRSLKCSKVSDQENVDRISSLPDELLGHMLSFLPTKTVVATSILSSRWRCLHMLTNCLSFDLPYEHRVAHKKALKKSFKKFVNRVLLLHKVSPIKKFSLDCNQHTFDDLDLHTWTSAAISKGVEQLHLSLSLCGPCNALPRCLFSCQSIVELQLSYIEIFRVAESMCLPNLKILHFRYISFLDIDSFGKFLSECPLLEKLVVEYCPCQMDPDYYLCLSSRVLKHLTVNGSRLQVDAPNLEYIQYTTEYGYLDLSLKNTDRLVSAILELYIKDDSPCQEDFEIQCAALITAIYQVKELRLMDLALENLTRSIDGHISLYPNLVKLHLGRCAWHAWKYVMYWLASSPLLETLIFEKGLIWSVFREDECPSDVALVPFSSRLKVIEATKFRGYKTELALLKYLLGNAEVLQRLTLYTKMSKERESQAYKELLMLPRASRTCVVQVK